MFKYTGQNRRPFSAICQNGYGREVITTGSDYIDESNIVDELASAITIHNQNAAEIQYLDNYYRGDQPILYRNKLNRPEINNKIVENLALFVVETKTAEMAGEPIQYVLHGTDEKLSEEIARLNTVMEGEDKPYYDIELCRWRSICGTAYRFIGANNSRDERLLDEVDFYITTEDPTETFVVYKSDRKDYPMYSCQIRKDENNNTIYNIYTANKFMIVKDGEVIFTALNGNRAIPVIEYPNNARRLSDIEITISITDEINKIASDRSNGIEGFVNSWIKFVNCEIDVETYKAMRQEGALVVKSNNGTDNKADVDVMTSELNQSETQVAVEDQYEKLLVIQGMANRNSTSSGDTGGAVMLRNGYYSQEKRSELGEPIFKRAERNFLRVVLNRLRVQNGFNLLPSDVEIKISRTKMDNIYTKTESLKMMLDSGIYPPRAIKSCDIWSDPEQVAVESKARMDILYPTTIVEEKEETDIDN